MNRIDEYKYHVVKFLENPFNDTERVNCEDVCVPKSWVKWCSPEDNIVKVWYPTQDPGNTEKKVRKREKKSDQWESFLCVLKYSTDLYEDAKIYIHKKNSEKNDKEDCTPLSELLKEKTSRTNSSVIQNEAIVDNTLDTLGWSVSSKSANIITLKKKAPADFDKPAHRKRSRVIEPSESVDEVVGPSSQAFELRSYNQTLTHKNCNEAPFIHETPGVQSNDRNSTEKKQIVNKKVSKANHSLGIESVVQLSIFEESSKLIRELQKHLGTPLVRAIIDKLMNTDNSRSGLTDDTTASATSDATAQASKLNEEKRNEEQIEENDSDEDDDFDDDDRDEDGNDDCDDNDARDEDDCGNDYCDDNDDINEHTKTKKNPPPIVKKVVPPKYDASDSDDCDEDYLVDDDCDDDDCDDDYLFEDDCDDDDDCDYDDRGEDDFDEDDCYDDDDRDEDDCGNDDCDYNGDINEHTKTIKNPPIVKKVLPPKYDANEDDCDDDDRDEDDCGNDDCDDNDDINDHTKTKKNPPPIVKKIVPPKYDANEDDCDDDDRDEDDCGNDDCDDNDDINDHTKTKKNPPPIVKKVVPPKYVTNESEDHDENNYNNVLLKTKTPQRNKKVSPKLDATDSKEDDLDDNERRKKKKESPRLLKTFVLPPEYDPNDSRWTLKYRERAPGLRELVRRSGVYVNGAILRKCIKKTGCSDKLCLVVLSEVFTSSALSTCSWTGKRASGSYPQGTNVRPGLDAHAREVIMNFLTGHDKERVKWRISNRGLLIRIMTRKMLAMRQK